MYTDIIDLDIIDLVLENHYRNHLGFYESDMERISISLG